ncbi:MAG: hypothetical protein E5Y73_11470 [Mesorhizobium sp.]|uniref:hypothetical protein n=1 Tax=Mesorhizobium sp. TaxID=1871066 RepID=UPI00121BAD7E|nr:hypothetical protein [Mesorhizobium sp.]TIL94531.1 MAG: hypothetical protein E5Y73_11470 [Mesorhizobium sp.]
MPEIGETAGGTQGATETPGFEYTFEDRAALMAAGCRSESDIDALQFLAREHLKTPTTEDRKRTWTEFRASCERINAAAVVLLNEMEAGGHWTQDRISDDYPERSDLVSQLLSLADWTEQAADHAEHEIPHSNSNWPWKQFMWQLCHFWDRRLGRPVARRQKQDEVGGPMIAFLVAAAGPVKLIRAPDNLTGKMTPEMASHHVRDYQRFSRDHDEGSLAVIAAVGAWRDKSH